MSSKEKMAPEIAPERSPGIVKGVVSDSKANKPIAGAEVTVLGTSAFFTTGTYGEYLILLPATSYILRVKANGYKPEDVRIGITVGAPLTQDIKLKKLGQNFKQS